MDCPQQRFQTVNESDKYGRRQNNTHVNGLSISDVVSICAMSSKLMFFYDIRHFSYLNNCMNVINKSVYYVDGPR